MMASLILKYVLIYLSSTYHTSLVEAIPSQNALYTLKATHVAPVSDRLLNKRSYSILSACALDCLGDIDCMAFTWNSKDKECKTFTDDNVVTSSEGDKLYSLKTFIQDEVDLHSAALAATVAPATVVTPARAAEPGGAVTASTSWWPCTNTDITPQDCPTSKNPIEVKAALRLGSTDVLLFTGQHRVYMCTLTDIRTNGGKLCTDVGSVNAVTSGVFQYSPHGAVALIKMDVSQSIYLVFRASAVGCFKYNSGSVVALTSVDCSSGNTIHSGSKVSSFEAVFGPSVPNSPDAVTTASWGKDASHRIYFIKGSQIWEAEFMNPARAGAMQSASILALPTCGITAVLESGTPSTYIGFHGSYVSISYFGVVERFCM